jgi:spermidine synthase
VSPYSSGLRDPSLVAIGAAGFAATIAQVLLLRELLVLFHGNEMSTGIALAGWLIWTSAGSALAARLSRRASPRESTLGLLLTLLALALPALVLLIRGARWLFKIPPGELATIGKMVLVCLSVPLLVCPIAGALFGLCWACRSAAESKSRSRSLTIYLGEALGAALGGLVFYFLLLDLATALGTANIVALLVLAAAGWLLHRKVPRTTARHARLVWLLTTVVVVLVSFLGTRLEESSRRWQWGEHLASARDTPYHNLSILRQGGQTSVFANGLWLFSLPDPATAELAVHPALLMHRRPTRLLFLGGGLAGQVREALEHPSIRAIDYVEQDPELVSHVDSFLSPEVRGSLRDPRVRLYHQDAGTFLRRPPGRYDVVLMNVGDPLNAQTNRFYAVESFRRISRHLAPGGIFTFSVPGGGDVVGPSHARLLGSMAGTLTEVFPQVAVLAGERARFLATQEPADLVLDASVAVDRIRERGLDLAHLREGTLHDLMNPLRLEYMESLLAELEGSPVNRQFSPVCYFHVVMLWAAQWHPGLEGILGAAFEIPPVFLAAGLAALGAFVTLFFWSSRPRYRTAVGASVFVQGACGMILQVVLILTFQILQGFAYLELALIIAAFMAGLGAGTMWVTAISRGWVNENRAVPWLLVLQLGVTAFPLLLLLFVSPSGEGLREGLSPASAPWFFALLSVAAGTLGGAHFSLAALASAAAGAPLGQTGGHLYAVDLAGAAGGAFLAGLLLLPLYGVSSTLILLSASSFVCLLALLRGPARPPARA